MYLHLVYFFVNVCLYFVFVWNIALLIILLGLLLGHLSYITQNVGSGGSGFYIDIHQCTFVFVYAT